MMSVASGLLCVALDPGPGQWLHRLARDFLVRPPEFPWRMALGARCTDVFGTEFDEYCMTRALGDGATIAEAGSLLETANWRAGGILLAAAGWPVELTLVKAAQDRHLRIGQYVETWYGYRRRLAPAPEWPAPDHLLLPDAAAVVEAAAEGIDAAHIHVVGNPVWEDVVADSGGNEAQWLFIDAPVRRDYADSLGYDENDAWRLVAAEHRRRNMTTTILFAPHPTDAARPIPEGAIAVRYQTSLLDRAGTVFGMFSAPLIDAYLRGRRVISVQPNLRRDMNPLSRRRLIPLATNPDTLRSALDSQRCNVDSDFQLALSGSLGRLRSATEEIMHA
jgi:hypothetical protein